MNTPEETQPHKRIVIIGGGPAGLTAAYELTKHNLQPIALEQTDKYHGLYHVLLGRIAPLEGIGPEQLTIEALVGRIREGSFKEVIMATNPTVEGDGTALYISSLLADLPMKITRLARGVTPGSVLEFANKEILSDALTGRQDF